MVLKGTKYWRTQAEFLYVSLYIHMFLYMKRLVGPLRPMDRCIYILLPCVKLPKNYKMYGRAKASLTITGSSFSLFPLLSHRSFSSPLISILDRREIRPRRKTVYDKMVIVKDRRRRAGEGGGKRG